MDTQERNNQLQIAMVLLLAQAKRSPVTITCNGLSANSEWLWTITNQIGETLALQGTEEQVLRSVSKW